MLHTSRGIKTLLRNQKVALRGDETLVSQKGGEKKCVFQAKLKRDIDGEIPQVLPYRNKKHWSYLWSFVNYVTSPNHKLQSSIQQHETISNVTYKIRVIAHKCVAQATILGPHYPKWIEIGGLPPPNAMYEDEDAWASMLERSL